MSVKVDMSGFQEIKQRINELDRHKRQNFYEQTLRELALRLLRKVVLRTPVGVMSSYATPHAKKTYWSGYAGGTLRRGWTAKTEAEAEAGHGDGDITRHVLELDVKRTGDDYYVIVSNPVHYASYVEYGHRQTPGRFVKQLGLSLVKPWVEGKHFLKISEEELRSQAPSVIMKKMKKFLKEVWQDGK